MDQTLNFLTIEKEINQNVKEKNKRYSALCKLLRTTEEYEECKNLYEYFVYEIARHLHSIGINDAENAVIYLDLILRNGHLSVTGKNDYHLFKYEKEVLPELLGTRTIGGASVCRHMSALTADILNVEYYASWLNCKYISDESEINDQSSYLHAVVGLICDDEKIIYDPTASSFAAKPTKDFPETEERLAQTFISYSKFALPGDYLILNPEQILLKKENKESLIYVWYAPLKRLIVEDFKRKIKSVTEQFYDTQKEIKELRENTSEIANRIVTLENSLEPHSDSPILKWKLRQSIR